MKNEVRTDSQKATIVADFHVFHGKKILNSYVYSNCYDGEWTFMSLSMWSRVFVIYYALDL